MKIGLQKNWWMLAINGLLAILFCAIILYDSEGAMITISLYFGLLVLLGGLMLLLGAYNQYRNQKDYSMVLAEGVVMGILGLIILIFPMQTLRIFLIIIGIWSLILGLLKVYIGIALRKAISFHQGLIFSGILMAVLGLLLLVDPTWTAAHLFKVVGLIFVLVGMMMVYFSFAIRRGKTIQP